MSKRCPKCLSTNNHKSGVVQGKQRYKCKSCGRNFREGDNRERYDLDKKLKVVKWSLEGAGIRSISRMEGVSAPLILKWIKKFSNLVRERVLQLNSDTAISVDIVEIDELVTWIKKNHSEIKRQKKLSQESIVSFGLLQIGMQKKLLILK